MISVGIILLSFVVYLFCLYKLTKEDYIFIKKNINPEQIFNLAFGASWTALLFSRVVFVLSHPDPMYMNPLIFLAFPQYPGLSLIGAVVGAVFFFLFMSITKKIPLGRVLDFFSLALLCTLPFAMLLFGLHSLRTHIELAFLIPVIYLVFAIFFMRLLYPRLIRGEIKDSTIAQLFFITFSIVSICTGIAMRHSTDIFLFSVEDYIAVGLFLLSLGIFLQRELIGKPERRGKK